MPKVSVIIPVYNVEQYLRECLDSVINQTLKDIEIICVDDCGKDNSMQILEKYSNDSRIKIIHHDKNKGLGPARNTGMEYATSDYIFFLDSDDYLELNILEKLYDTALKTKSDIVASTNIAFADDESEDTLFRTKDLNKWLNDFEIENYKVNTSNFFETITNFNCVSWGHLFSKEFLTKNNLKFIDANVIHEDNGFWLKTCSCFPIITCIKDVGVNYRIRTNAITTDINKKYNKNKKRKNMQLVLKDAVSYIKKYKKNNKRSFLQQIRSCPDYSDFYKINNFIYKYYWATNDKIIRVLGIPLYREKVKDGFRIKRVLGITYCKEAMNNVKTTIQNSSEDKLRLFYVTSEYVDPDSLKIFDGGLANYLVKITTYLSGLGHDINVLVIKAKQNRNINYNGVNVYFRKVHKRNKVFEYLFWPFFSKTRRNKIKDDAVFITIHKFLQQENKKQKIDLIQYASYLATGKCPEKDIPSCVRISSYAKLMQKYYNYSNPTEINNEIIQFKNAKFIFGPSEHIASYIENDLNLKNKIKIIESPKPNLDIPLDLSTYNKLTDKLNNNPYLLFFGTIGELKGCREISECLFDILNKYKNLFFVMVGKSTLVNNIYYVDAIKQKALNFKNRVVHIDSLSHNQLYPIIQGAKGVIMPSLTENFSNACVEAMSLEKIVIGTERNFSQLIKDGENGFLCKIQDSKSLEEKIIELMSLSEKDYENMQIKSALRTNVLTLENICNQLLDYYYFVINNWEGNK